MRIGGLNGLRLKINLGVLLGLQGKHLAGVVLLELFESMHNFCCLLVDHLNGVLCIAGHRLDWLTLRARVAVSIRANFVLVA